MNFLNRLKIKTKIILILSTALVGFATLLLTIETEINSSKKNFVSLQDKKVPLLAIARANEIYLEQIFNAISNAAIIGDESYLNKAQELINSVEASLDQAVTLGASAQSVQALKAQIQNYYQPASQMSSEMIEGSIEYSTFAERGKNNTKAYEQARLTSSAFVLAAENGVKDLIAEAKTAANETAIISRTIGFITLALVFAVGIAIAASMTKAVNGVAISLEEFARGDGDLTGRIDYSGSDEVGTLVRHFNQFVEKLRISIKATISSVETLQGISEELQQSGTVVTKNISSQGKAVELTSEALKSMLASADQIAERASEASVVASSAHEESTSGADVVGKTISTINDLAENINSTSEEMLQLQGRTNNVGAILDTIRGIAEQTNLLALNAAIEAARAGEQGRGFAVVADEVRSLASRTQGSTQEIQQVLEELQQATSASASSMQLGSDMAVNSVDQSSTAGQSLRNINEKVGGIATINNQIALATEEQKHISEQIRLNLQEIENLAQNSTFATSKFEGVNHSLVNVSQQLKQVTSQFNV